MVDFRTVVALTHESFRELGGEYDTQQDAQELMGFAGEVWQNNKDELKEAGRAVAKEAIKQALRRFLA